jgi:hypothetical protein
VSTNCGTQGSSGYSTSSFTTSAPFVCNSPSGLTSTVTSSSATVNWSAVTGAVIYAVDYKLSTEALWTSATTSTTATGITISGLSASSLYDYRVSTNCGTNGTSGFASAQFTTTAASVCGTAFEPNETTTAEAAITSGVVNSAAITTSTDVDYFKITTTATSNITYSLVGPSGVDFDLTIYNNAGTQLGTATGSTATETISLTSQAAGTYYIKVFGYSGAFSATCYTIQATATTVTSCQSPKDTSTNNTTAGAAVIPFNTNITGQINTSTDVDYYKFKITTGGTITITLTTLPADYDLYLYNSTGTTQVASSLLTLTSNETINYPATSGTTYYVKVVGYNSAYSAASCYTLKVALGTATKPNEYFSDNNTSLEVYPNPVQQVLNFKQKGGISEVFIYNVNGVQLMRKKIGSIGTTSNSLDVAKLPKGIYIIKTINKDAVTTRAKFIKE